MQLLPEPEESNHRNKRDATNAEADPFLESRQANVNDLLMMIPPRDNCSALYIECIPHPFANGTLDPTDFGVMPKKEVPPKPMVNPIQPVIQPSKTPTVIAHRMGKKLKEDVGIEHDWPWIAEVYKEGKLSCTGIILDRRWVLVHYGCIGYVK